MTSVHAAKVLIFVENRAEVLFVEGIFRDLVDTGQVEIMMAWTLSGAIGLAQSSLLQYPQAPIALALNAASTEEAAEQRGSIERILAGISTGAAWSVSFAIPDMTTWARRDPSFEQALSDQKHRREKLNKYDVAVLFKDWSQSHQFNRPVAASCDLEFANLDEFVASCLAENVRH